MADSDIKLKRKVQIRSKVNEPEKPVHEENSALNTYQKPEKSKSKIWLWLILSLITVGFIAYLVLSKSNNEPASTPQQQAIEAVEESPASADSIPAEVTPTAGDDVTVNDADQNANTNNVTSETNSDSDNSNSVVNTASSISNDVEAEAMKVIRGNYGVGQERKAKLGSKYTPIQSRVNELKREGVF